MTLGKAGPELSSPGKIIFFFPGVTVDSLPYNRDAVIPLLPSVRLRRTQQEEKREGKKKRVRREAMIQCFFSPFFISVSVVPLKPPV